MTNPSLRGASADALSELRAKVADTKAADLATLGDDLLGAAGVIRSEGALRRVLTDPSVEAKAKAGLVSNIFGGKATPAAVAVLADAAGRRWTVARDLADALEHLGVAALVRSAGEGNRQLSSELFEVRSLLRENGDLREALTDPARSTTDRAALLTGLLDGKVQPTTLRLVRQAFDGSHRTIEDALEYYQDIADAQYNESSATVHSARPLDEAEQNRLAAALSAQYGRPVHLNLIVDPTIVGGIKVEIGDDVIDGSIRSKIEDASRRLAG